MLASLLKKFQIEVQTCQKEKKAGNVRTKFKKQFSVSYNQIYNGKRCMCQQSVYVIEIMVLLQKNPDCSPGK
jgi:hypothetical protein